MTTTDRPVASLMEDIAESIDRIVSVDVCAPHIIRGSIVPVYEAARKIVGGPLCLAAAEKLKESCTLDRTVIIASGFVLKPFMPVGETDGLSGAVALARAINRAFGSRILILCEQECVQPLEAICRACCRSKRRPPGSSPVPLRCKPSRWIPSRQDSGLRRSIGSTIRWP